MTGSLLSKLKLPPRRYDPAGICRNFETLEFAIKRDERLTTCLDRTLRRDSTLVDPGKARALIRRLNLLTDPSLEDFLSEVESNSLASYVLTREVRRKTCGAILAYLKSYNYREIAAVTLVDYRQIVPANELAYISPRDWTRAFTRKLRDYLPKHWVGELFGFWECEFEPNRRQWQGHQHLFATDDVLIAIRAYIADARSEIIAGSETIKRPYKEVDFSAKSVNDFAKWSAYIAKIEPKARMITLPDKDGNTVRARRDHYMADEFRSSYALFLDSIEIRDLIVLMGVKPSKEGFISTRR